MNRLYRLKLSGFSDDTDPSLVSVRDIISKAGATVVEDGDGDAPWDALVAHSVRAGACWLN